MYAILIMYINKRNRGEDLRLAAYKGDKPYIFVSYAPDDKERVLPVIQKLQKQGFRLWFDQGVGTSELTAKRLNEAEGVIVFLSKAAVQSADCSRDITLAIEKENDPLIIYLEDVELSTGMQFQLNGIPALSLKDFSSDEGAVAQICTLPLFDRCRDQGSAFIRTVKKLYTNETVFNTVVTLIAAMVLLYCFYYVMGWTFLDSIFGGAGSGQSASSSSSLGDLGDDQRVTLKSEDGTNETLVDIYYRQADGIVYNISFVVAVDISEQKDRLKTPEGKKQLLAEYEANVTENAKKFECVEYHLEIVGEKLHVTYIFDKLDQNENAKAFAKHVLKTYTVCNDAANGDYLMHYSKVVERQLETGDKLQ